MKTAQGKHIGYVARLWKVVTVDGVEESREIFNKSTYKASPKIVNVGTASADPNVSAVIGARLQPGMRQPSMRRLHLMRRVRQQS